MPRIPRMAACAPRQIGPNGFSGESGGASAIRCRSAWAWLSWRGAPVPRGLAGRNATGAAFYDRRRSTKGTKSQMRPVGRRREKSDWRRVADALQFRAWPDGEMAEWPNAPVLKTGSCASGTGVRIPLSPERPLRGSSTFKVHGTMVKELKCPNIEPECRHLIRILSAELQAANGNIPFSFRCNKLQFKK